MKQGKYDRTIHAFVLQSGYDGATLEEVAERFGFTPQLVGEAMTRLYDIGKIWQTTLTRDVGLIPGSVVWRAI